MYLGKGMDLGFFFAIGPACHAQPKEGTLQVETPAACVDHNHVSSGYLPTFLSSPTKRWSQSCCFLVHRYDLHRTLLEPFVTVTCVIWIPYVETLWATAGTVHL